MSSVVDFESRELKIGDVARLTGTTARTIRYYEELGLLPGATERRAGAHRLYSQSDVDRLQEVLRLKDLLGLSLEQLRQLVAAEDARAVLREEFRHTDDPIRQQSILREALVYIARQLELVKRRHEELESFEDLLLQKQRSVAARLKNLEQSVGADDER